MGLGNLASRLWEVVKDQERTTYSRAHGTPQTEDLQVTRHSGRTNPLEDAIRVIQSDEANAAPGAPIETREAPPPSLAIAPTHERPQRVAEASEPVIRVVHAPLPVYLRPPGVLIAAVLLIGLGVVLGWLFHP